MRLKICSNYLLFLITTGNLEELKNALSNVDDVQKKYLLSYRDDNGASLLHICSRTQNTNIADFLVKDCGLDVNAITIFNSTAGHEAIICGQLDMVDILINKLGLNVGIEDKDGLTLLHLAICFKQRDIFEWLINSTNINKYKKSKQGASLLHYCTLYGDLEFVTLVLKGNTFNVNDQMANGMTPLYLACQEGHLSIAKLLVLSYHADILITANDGTSVLHAAVESNCLPLVQWIAKHEHGKKLLFIQDKSKSLPIHTAANLGYTSVISFLVKTLQNMDKAFLDSNLPKVVYSALNYGHVGVFNSVITKVKIDPVNLTDLNNSKRVAENGWTLGVADRQNSSKPSSEISALSASNKSVSSVTNVSVCSSASGNSSTSPRVRSVIPPAPPLPPPPPPLPPQFLPLKPILAKPSSDGLINSLRQHFMRQKVDNRGEELIDELKKFDANNLRKIADRNKPNTTFVLPKSARPVSTALEVESEKISVSTSTSLEQLATYVTAKQPGKESQVVSPNSDKDKENLSSPPNDLTNELLSYIPKEFTNGNPIPPWQRQLKAKRLAQQIQEIKDT